MSTKEVQKRIKNNSKKINKKIKKSVDKKKQKCYYKKVPSRQQRQNKKQKN